MGFWGADWGAALLLAGAVGLSGIGCGSNETGSGGSGASASGGSGGGGAGGTGGKATSAYDPAHVIQVEVTMAPADWDGLRFQVNDVEQLLGGDCLSGPKDSVFTYFPGSVKLDGQDFPEVAIRKKGFLGSMSASRPSLKIKLDEVDPNARYFEADKLTLNNVKQDGSRIRTCLAFELFAAAGVPSPRCSFAHVVVNGDDLGIYANVESVGKGMLAAHFENPDGNLYEGQMSDFRPDWENTYEKKTNETDPDRSDLAALTTALTAPDADLLAQVSERVDIDAFLTFWAAEAMLAAWDGYTGDQNNHQAYHDPTTDKFYFIPWGPDATFDSENPLSDGTAPLSVYASSALPNRLYQLPEIREQYRTRLLELIDKVMVADTVLAEIDRMEALLSPYLTGDPEFGQGLDQIRAFVTDRAAVLKTEVQNGPAEFSLDMPVPPCVAPIGTISGTFETKLAETTPDNPFVAGDGTLHLDLNNMPADGNTVGSMASVEGNSINIMIVALMPGGQISVAVFVIDPTFIKKGGDLPIDAQQAFGIHGKVANGDQFQLLGFLTDGTLHLDEAGLNEGDAYKGTFTATALSWP